ncbi:SDR family NAD(P)-dependent oxidoreductase [Bacteroides sp.]
MNMSYNPFSLKGKTILVTGASSGIGRAVAIECSKMGAIVYITARNKKRLEETLEQMEQPELHTMKSANLARREELENLTGDLPDCLDGVVQCAGLTITKPFVFVSEDNMHDVMAVNFEASVLLTQLLLKKKKILKGASLIFISSISGVYVSLVGNSIYSASKGAINGISKALALELAGKQIRVNTITPGMVETNIIAEGIISDEQLTEDTKRYPLKRYGKPEEVAYAAIYLLSDASKWVTGSNLLIDGGYTLV